MIGKFDIEKAFDYENGFILTSEPYRMANLLSHYELYKKIIELPGDIVELGVFKGSSLIQMATFRELLENEKSRTIIGFDTFGKFPHSSDNMIESDKNFICNWNQKFKNEFISKQDIQKSLEVKGFKNIELVEGDICETVEDYIKEYPQLRISLLHIDVDVYHPTKIGLELLFDRVVTGGVVIFDDYATVEGETKAIEEFFYGKGYIIKKFPFSQKKPSYIIKK